MAASTASRPLWPFFPPARSSACSLFSVAVPAFISGYYYLYYISRPVYLRYIGFNAVVMETVYEFN